MAGYDPNQPRDSFGEWSSSGLDAHTKARKSAAEMAHQKKELIKAHNSKNLAWRQDQAMKADKGKRTLVEKGMGHIMSGRWERQEMSHNVHGGAKATAAMIKALQNEQDKALKAHHYNVNHPVKSFFGRVAGGMAGAVKKAVFKKYR